MSDANRPASRRLRLRVLVVGTAVVCANAQTWAQTTYTCARLHDKLVGDGYELGAATTRINRRGEVAGNGRDERKAVRWTQSLRERVAPLDPKCRNCHSLGINDDGDVAGFEDASGLRAFVWNGTQMTFLPPLQYGAAAHGLNNVGQVVGSSLVLVDRENQWHATMWDHGVAVDLGTLPGGHTAWAFDINDAGVAVGKSDTTILWDYRAVRWDHGIISELGGWAGSRHSEAAAINAKGVIVGSIRNASGSDHAVAWTEAGIVDLDVLSGHRDSYALDINRVGTVVGHSTGGTDVPPSAAVWFGLSAKPLDLNTLVGGEGCVDEAGMRRRLTSATGVNDKGQIAATSKETASDGRVHVAAFRLTPQPLVRSADERN